MAASPLVEHSQHRRAKDVVVGLDAAELRMPAEVLPLLRCPRCGEALGVAEDALECQGQPCRSRYPLVEGIPVLVNEARSVFAIEDFLVQRPTFFKRRSLVARALDALVPTQSLNISTAANVQRFRAGILSDRTRPVVLVLGGSIAGQGMQEFLDDDSLCLFETDVSFGPRTQAIVDAHDIPLADGSVDAVIVQAVLEHVLNPQRCVAEIWRVLAPRGVVYAEVPFMQPVHGAAYDFTRYSHLGLLYLFRQFDEIESGVACGPGSALAYALSYFIHSFGPPGWPRKVLNRIGRLIAGPLKYADLLLGQRANALDAASALYFSGRRSDRELSARELIGRYRGGQR